MKKVCLCVCVECLMSVERPLVILLLVRQQSLDVLNKAVHIDHISHTDRNTSLLLRPKQTTQNVPCIFQAVPSSCEPVGGSDHPGTFPAGQGRTRVWGNESEGRGGSGRDPSPWSPAEHAQSKESGSDFAHLNGCCLHQSWWWTNESRVQRVRVCGGRDKARLVEGSTDSGYGLFQSVTPKRTGFSWR